MQRIFILLLLISLYSCDTEDPDKKAVEKISLEKTDWNGQFYIYSNFYHFGTNKTGYSDDGQVAWSCPIDYKAKKIPGNKILYPGQEKFRYQIKKDTLTIEYFNENNSKDRVFIYRKDHNDWISLNTYTYGFEVLKPGRRKEFFDEPVKIQR